MATPVHIFTSGDEAELFLNGKSLGRKKKAAFEYRLRFDEVVYQPGELKVVAYKDGKQWATDLVNTSDEAAMLTMRADRKNIKADGNDLSFITVEIHDKNGNPVPDAHHTISFSLDGAAAIIATDNGDPASLVSFASTAREAYFGLALAVVQAGRQAGKARIYARSPGLKTATLELNIEK